MRMLFKQRLLSLLDSYDIYDEEGNTLYTVEGRFSISHHLDIYDANGNHVGTIKQKVFTLLPTFEVYLGEDFMGYITKEFSFFRPKYNIDFNGWHIEGDVLEWDYSIIDAYNQEVASVSKQIYNWTDTYSIDVDQDHALLALLVVLAIDCEKCSRN